MKSKFLTQISEKNENSFKTIEIFIKAITFYVCPSLLFPRLLKASDLKVSYHIINSGGYILSVLLLFSVLFLLFKLRKKVRENRILKNEKDEIAKKYASLENKGELFEELFELLPFNCYVSDFDDRYLLVNRHLCLEAELPQQEIEGFKRDELGHFIDKKERDLFREEIKKEGIIHDREIKVNYKRTERTYLFSSRQIKWEGKNAFLTASFNITERKELERALEESEKRLKLAFESANEGLWDCNLKTGEVYYSPGVYKLLGYEFEEFKPDHETWRKILKYDDFDRLMDHFNSFVEGLIDKFEIEVRMETKKGETIWVLSRGKIVEYEDNGKPLRFIGTQVDITDLKKAEESIRASEENLRVTMNSIGDAVIATDMDGKVTAVNPVAEKLTGWISKDAKGKYLSDIFKIYSSQTGEVQKNPVEQVLATGNIVGLANHTVMVSKDGEIYNISDSGAPIRNSKGKITGVVLVFRDVTGEYELNEKLRQSQKMEALGTLASGIAHDFNNILTGIVGYGQLARLKINETEVVEKYLKRILKASDRATDITTRVLTFSRKRKYRKEFVELGKEINESLKLLRSSIPATIEIDKSIETDGKIYADTTRIHQVVMNLCTNAYHAIDESGKISVSLNEVEIEKPRFIRGKIAPEGKYLKLEVMDNGEGMDEETLRRAFDPYYTTKKKGEGTGLGLSIVHAIIEEHNAFVDLISKKNVGTRFTIYFPENGSVQHHETEQNITPVEINGTENIMVVDDELNIREICNAILEDHGYKVATFENGKDAFEAFKKEPDSFNLVVTDFTMPKMNGDKLISQIRAINPDIPFILITGLNDLSDLSDTIRHVVKVMKKPFDNDDFLNLVRNSLDSKNHSSQVDCIQEN